MHLLKRSRQQPFVIYVNTFLTCESILNPQTDQDQHQFQNEWRCVPLQEKELPETSPASPEKSKQAMLLLFLQFLPPG